ncbi:RNA polymerase III subunit C82 [Microbotryomycetes sp. JL221]|nr:RNA polymerase III subunit C82 [Microbotryomycetes sp. JL221]
MASLAINDKSRLVHHVILQHFGQATAEIASLLLSRGALSLTQLAKLSNLSSSTLHTCLLSLSIHCLLFHSEIEVQGRIVEVYELNVSNVLNRTRGGLYIQLAKELSSSSSSSSTDQHSNETWIGFDVVVQQLWCQGMLTKQELENLVIQHLRDQGYTSFSKEGVAQSSKSLKQKGKEKVKEIHLSNGDQIDHDDDDETIKLQVDKMLRRAFNESFIVVVTPGSQLDPESLAIKWEEELKLKITNIPSAKELKQVQVALQEKQDEWNLSQFVQARGRTENDVKKRKLRPDETELDLPELPEHAFFKINPDRFNILWRREILVEYVRDMYNDTIAKVFEIVLEASEDSIETMKDDRSRPISRLEINTRWKQLSSEERNKFNLQKVFSKTSLLKEFEPNKLSTIDLLTEICSLLSGVGGGGIVSSISILKQIGEGNSSKWFINYKSLGIKLKRSTVEAVIKDKFGTVGLRCWKILEVKGKLDEKHLARLAFLSAKEARETVGRLSTANLIEQQDVPRSQDHAPSRTFYLWSVNPRQTIQTLLDHHFKALSNLNSQRIQQLKLNQNLISKRNRLDVRNDPQGLLTTRDRLHIQTLDEIVEALSVAEFRIQKQVFVLDEFADSKHF